MLKKTHSCFNVSIEDKIAHITLSRGEAMNTMTKEFWNELPAIVREIDRDALARVIVISSTGKHFSGGMDTTVFTGDRDAPKHDRYIMAEALRSNIRHIQHSFSKVQVADIHVDQESLREPPAGNVNKILVNQELVN